MNTLEQSLTHDESPMTYKLKPQLPIKPQNTISIFFQLTTRHLVQNTYKYQYLLNKY